MIAPDKRPWDNATTESCAAPVFSLIKQWGQTKDEDILVPVTTGKANWTLYNFPWDEKKSKEWREHVDVGVLSGDDAVSREVVIDGRRFNLRTVGFLPFSESARFRYTLNLDGITASYRLAKLLSLNSVVLKQDKSLQAMASRGQEFAYHYLRPEARKLYWRQALTEYRKLFGEDMDQYIDKQKSKEWREHVDVGVLSGDDAVSREVVIDGRRFNLRTVGFLPFSESARFRYTLNLDGITASYRLAKLLSLNSVVLKQDKNLQAMASRGQEFAYHYLRPEARKLYWRQALTEYRKLFGEDMDQYIDKQKSKEWREHVDVGVLSGDDAVSREVVIDGRRFNLRTVGFLPFSESARFRYTLNLDGITASYRLAKLLSLNSVVLKQASPWIEWYYRSLVPNVHYVSFWEHSRDDVLYVIDSLRRQSDKNLQAMASRGQEFAYHYLRPEARKLYWRQALTEYRKLFGEDMDQYIDKQELPAPLHPKDMNVDLTRYLRRA
ncbi:hypothetical protein HYH03_001457 [Edaphochlamys debaryana]|uniref:Glycosyl transferase CAP10 domain-containing protein n=1 Tax=Edaphochlamys debaryana TaxID=47281 RepID=A0A835YGU4_9CHLO|nr:hypothetical protein HYH03_001457 [Edaphochlamys debaryana]|eukprot:KAG2500691.1 hypothetical protein HYH03_001457 [Edaphochlamys debaryana]